MTHAIQPGVHVGGDGLELIRHHKSLSDTEARRWARDWIGEIQHRPTPTVAAVPGAMDSKKAVAEVIARLEDIAALTLIEPGASLRHYITGLRIERHAAALLVAGTTPVVITTTNLPGALAFSVPMEAAAQGSVYEKALDPVRTIMASAQNTATTIVASLATSVIWRISATFYVAP